MYNITLDILERTAALAVEDAVQAVAESKAAAADAVNATLRAELLARRARVAVIIGVVNTTRKI